MTDAAKEFNDKLINVAQQLVYFYDSYGADRDTDFDSLVRCAVDQKLSGNIQDTASLRLANLIVHYAYKDALHTGLIAPDGTGPMLGSEHYIQAQVAAHTLSENIDFSEKMYHLVEKIADQLADVLADYFPEYHHMFGYLPTDMKVLYGRHVSHYFNEIAKQEIWHGLDRTDVFFDPSLQHAHGAAYALADLQEALKTKDVRDIQHANEIVIGPSGLNLDMPGFSSTLIHECIHDTFNQINVSLTTPAVQEFSAIFSEKEILNDIRIAMARKSNKAPINLFVALYYQDFEEKLCRHAQEKLEDKLRRFRPSHQLSYTPA